MNHKLLVLPAVICLGCTALAGAVENKVLEAELLRQTAAAQSSYQNWYADYQQKIAQVTAPSYQTLLPLFKELARYNFDFNECSSWEESSRLARKLAQPTDVGWNFSKQVGIVELFDTFFPDEINDTDIAALEHNIKTGLLSKEQWDLIEQFEEKNPSDEFAREYRWLRRSVEFSADSKAVMRNLDLFIPLMEAYLMQSSNEQEFLKKSAFIDPIQAGWNRTMSLKEILFKIGTDEWADGEQELFNSKGLQGKYDVSEQTATLFSSFMHAFKN